MYYREDQRLGLTEFSEVFMDNLSRLISNQTHIDQNFDFYEHYIFKSFELYNNSKTQQYTISQILALFEIMLDSLFKYSPSTELPIDSITIS